MAAISQQTTAFSPSALSIFDVHFYVKGEEGHTETSPAEVFKRMARFYVENGLSPTAVDRLVELHEAKQFSFNSPVYYNARGRKGKAPLFACYVSRLADSMTSITSGLQQAMLIFQTGAGYGLNIGMLRPEFASVGDGGVRQLPEEPGYRFSSGPMSYLRLFHTAGDIVKSAGKRRAAIWAGMRYDHPDIFKFVTAKRNPETRPFYTNINISVLLDKEFIRACEDDREVKLVWAGRTWKSVRARELLSEIIESNFRCGDPGFVYIDEINAHNTTPTFGDIDTCNACTEVPLPGETSCNLGAVMLHNVLLSLPSAHRNEDGIVLFNHREFLAAISKIAKTVMPFLDANIDLNSYPPGGFENRTKAIRPIGLGISGLGECFFAAGLRYGEEAAIKLAASIMAELTLAATEWSLDEVSDETLPCLAAESPTNHTAFLAQCKHYAHEARAYDLSDDIQKRWDRVCGRLAEGALYRNSYVTCIAPTGNTSVMMDSPTSGCEPAFGLVYPRNTRNGVLQMVDSEFVQQAQPDSAFVAQIFAEKDYERAPEILDARQRRYFVCAHDLAWRDRLALQGALQAFTSLAISSTINLQHGVTKDEIRELLIASSDFGLKGFTIFRDGSVKNAPIVMTSETDGAMDDTMPVTDAPPPRPETTQPAATPAAATAATDDTAKIPDSYRQTFSPKTTSIKRTVTRQTRLRDEFTFGFTKKIRVQTPVEMLKYYVTINENAEEHDAPIEVFLTGGSKCGTSENALNEALARLVSLWLQDGGPVDKIVNSLIGIHAGWKTGVLLHPADQFPVQVTSTPDALAKFLRRWYIHHQPVRETEHGVECPECQHRTLIRRDACWVCVNQGCRYEACPG